MDIYEAQKLKRGDILIERGELKYTVIAKPKFNNKYPSKIEIKLKYHNINHTINESNLSFYEKVSEDGK